MAGDVQRRVVVRGRVQGVFFRDSTKREADAKGVRGWVRNREDGAVEAVFEGSEEAVDALIRWCREGPARANVEDMDVSLGEDPDGFSGFEVR